MPGPRIQNALRSERHLPISEARAYTLTARQRDEVYVPESENDENGVVAPGTRSGRGSIITTT